MENKLNNQIEQANNGRAVVGILIAVVLAVAFLASETAEPQTNRQRTTADAQFTAGGTEACINCHGGESMAIMADSPHGNLDNPYSPFSNEGCESCHGAGSLHVSRAAGGAGFPPLLQFGEKGAVSEKTAACIGCHAEDMGDLEGMEWVGSLHDTDEVTCVSCHRAHTTENAMEDRAKQTESCAGCHEEEMEQHRRFENQGINFDKLFCYDCHDVHQLIARPE
jgi:DmsE family decaheme c-type cytochrome